MHLNTYSKKNLVSLRLDGITQLRSLQRYPRFILLKSIDCAANPIIYSHHLLEVQRSIRLKKWMAKSTHLILASLQMRKVLTLFAFEQLYWLMYFFCLNKRKKARRIWCEYRKWIVWWIRSNVWEWEWRLKVGVKDWSSWIVESSRYRIRCRSFVSKDEYLLWFIVFLWIALEYSASSFGNRDDVGRNWNRIQ